MSEFTVKETNRMAVVCTLQMINMFPRVQRSSVSIVRRVQDLARHPREVVPSEQQAMKKTREASVNRDE
jgi:hypothetical protein